MIIIPPSRFTLWAATFLGAGPSPTSTNNPTTSLSQPITTNNPNPSPAHNHHSSPISFSWTHKSSQCTPNSIRIFTPYVTFLAPTLMHPFPFPPPNSPTPAHDMVWIRGVLYHLIHLIAAHESSSSFLLNCLIMFIMAMIVQSILMLSPHHQQSQVHVSILYLNMILVLDFQHIIVVS